MIKHTDCVSKEFGCCTFFFFVHRTCIIHSIQLQFTSLLVDRLLHPLSPRGKLVHWGLEGLAATNAMIEAAINATTRNTGSFYAGSDIHPVSTVRLRDELYRIAISNEQQQQLQEIASAYPTIAEWKDNMNETNEIQIPNHDTFSLPNAVSEHCANGGLRLYNGCCVLHVPSYLRGVFHACEVMAQKTNSSIRWCHIRNQTQSENDSSSAHDQYDATVYCYGSNMFQRSDSNKQVVDFTALSSNSSSQVQPQLSDVGTVAPQQLPVQLVRGQSMEVTLVQPLQHALLCGKYISPLPHNHDQTHRALIGATHEFSHVAMTTEQVIADLQTRTKDFAPFRYNDIPPLNDVMMPEIALTLPNHVKSVDRITCGYRVQSTRGAYGRRPIIGLIPTIGTNKKKNQWIFTGLSSRGLLYHALYGQLLAQAILQDDESVLLDSCPDILWWKS